MTTPASLPDNVLKQLDVVTEQVAKDLCKITNRDVRVDGEGVGELDAWIKEVRGKWEAEHIATMTIGFGAFFGTAIINEVGGDWIASDQGPLVQTHSEVPYVISPFESITKQFAPDSKESIVQLLDLLMGAR